MNRNKPAWPNGLRHRTPTFILNRAIRRVRVRVPARVSHYFVLFPFLLSSIMTNAYKKKKTSILMPRSLWKEKHTLLKQEKYLLIFFKILDDYTSETILHRIARIVASDVVDELTRSK